MDTGPGQQDPAGRRFGQWGAPGQSGIRAEYPAPTPTVSQVSQKPRGVIARAVIFGLLAGAVSGALVATAIGGGAAGGSGSTGSLDTTSPIVINPVPEEAGVAQVVAAKVLPSVVNITNMQEGFDFFTGQSGLTEAGTGSGVIIRRDGYVLTNYHVIAGANQLIVNAGVKSFVAVVIGTDPSSDLAVLKIEGSGFTPIEIGSSADLIVGQWVMAVGSPFGLDQTVTTGIVSALQRTDIMQDQNAGTVTLYTNLIQTDAAINPGNSGGALVDDRGRLIGVNSLIQSPSGTVGAAQSAGIGFAIPSDYAMMVAEEIMETGRATHPFLGVSTQTVDRRSAALSGLPVDAGAIVVTVVPGSPADTAGMREGDIITRIGDAGITSTEEVFAAIRSHRVGDIAEVTALRNGGTQTFTVTLVENTGQ